MPATVELDTAAEWVLTRTPAGLIVTRERPEVVAEVMLRGPVAGLALVPYRRRPGEVLDVTGDAALFELVGGMLRF
ncbi:hypothetical protein AB0F91_08560 [Amycolatopsis sp. NPDC023774]|uniref:hypothetical protein n=1 Tax=Amycolatopsis sp. NPDC023774 TaxID=3155015 RepID=UPI0033DC993D